EVDIYLLSRRNVDAVASDPDVATCVRRVFYGVEEPLEIHLSAIEGVAERFETPYFDNLKRYAQRPIGTFHALPIARGNSTFKSHHYGMVIAGAQPYYVEAYPMTAYSMYGGVPLRSLKKALLDLKAAGLLHRVRLVTLTNCTFDGHVYNTRRVMEELLAIKPDL